MNWYELSNNPDGIKRSYVEPPDLSHFIIREFFLCGHTPSLRIYGELSQPPDAHLADSSAVASIGLAFWNATEFAMNGWPTDTAVSIAITPAKESGIAVAASGDNASFSANAGSFYIESLKVYSDEYVAENQRTLVSYRNVWNSCLLELRQNGFQLELSDAPAPDGSASHCRWHATKDNTVLKAQNPIELLGLAGLFHVHGHSNQRNYWWRVDGPNIVGELRDAWEIKHHGPQKHG